jgi:sugar phosphate isomerase/epimerase
MTFMKTSRREFIRTALAGSGLIINSYDAFNLLSSAGKFLESIGIATSISDNEILAAAGYSFVEETVSGILVPAEDDSAFNKKLDLLKLSKLPVEVCNIFLPGNLKCVGPAPAHEEILKRGDIVFKRAQAAGIKIIVFGSGGSRGIPKGFLKNEAKIQFINLCKQLAASAQKCNIILSLEPLNTEECNFINSLTEGAEIVVAVKNENFRLMADLYHMLKENEDPSNIIKYGHLLYHTHIAEKNGRTAPGVNKEDFIPYFKALKKIKYTGRMTIECNWRDIREQAGPAYQYLKKQIASG